MSIVPVADNEILYRRIPCIEGLYVIQADGTVKVSSAAFSDRSFRPSVDRAELCHNDPKETQHDQSVYSYAPISHICSCPSGRFTPR